MIRLYTTVLLHRVIKDATEQDKISKNSDKTIYLEVEAARLMNNFPCIIIHGDF